MVALTFIIPIRHYESSPNWDTTKKNLASTINSINSQTSDNWRCIIVANRGSSLPPLPEKVHVHWVDFPPNHNYNRNSSNHSDFVKSIRIDKGLRIAAGINYSRETDYYMFVDDDDFINNKLVQFVEQNPDSNGWYFHTGLIWRSNSSYIFKQDNFSKFCGTSHIISQKLIPKDIDTNNNLTYVENMLGSHTKIEDILKNNNTPLRKLPFHGAVYHIGHNDTHSNLSGYFRYIFNRESISNPLLIIKKFRSLKKMDRNTLSTFFGN
ncbi:glycosyltransferase family A protein [Tenacibaculum sp.]|uniref:glycosyltransferase family A protein n=1 Tax=Tenacibaculum sp. TaxID=1906242 RepID=UPI003AA8E4ED